MKEVNRFFTAIVLERNYAELVYAVCGQRKTLAGIGRHLQRSAKPALRLLEVAADPATAWTDMHSAPS